MCTMDMDGENDANENRQGIHNETQNERPNGNSTELGNRKISLSPFIKFVSRIQGYSGERNCTPYNLLGDR